MFCLFLPQRVRIRYVLLWRAFPHFRRGGGGLFPTCFYCTSTLVTTVHQITCWDAMEWLDKRKKRVTAIIAFHPFRGPFASKRSVIATAVVGVRSVWFVASPRSGSPQRNWESSAQKSWKLKLSPPSIREAFFVAVIGNSLSGRVLSLVPFGAGDTIGGKKRIGRSNCRSRCRYIILFCIRTFLSPGSRKLAGHATASMRQTPSCGPVVGGPKCTRRPCCQPTINDEADLLPS